MASEQTAFVRNVTTTAARILTTVTALNRLNGGAFLARVLRILPSWLSRFLLRLGPWVAPLGVGVAMVAAMVLVMVVALIGHARSSTTPAGSQDLPARQRSPQQAQAHSTEDTVNWDTIAASVQVEVTPDGSVIVHGLPESVPEHLRDHVARIAADAAIIQLRHYSSSANTEQR